MRLTDADLERFARQIVIPGIGVAGQTKLLASRVLVAGAQEGVRQALLYLERTGINAHEPDVGPAKTPASTPDCILIAGLNALGVERRTWLLSFATPIVWYVPKDSRLQFGIVRPGETLPHLDASPLAESCTTEESILHRVGACEAVARVAAVILGWEVTPTRGEVDFA